MLLIANDAVHYLRFDLLPLGDPHLDWHGLRIELCALEMGVVHALPAASDVELFLDRAITPEVPPLCDALERVLMGESLRFTNLDERDFELSAEPAPGGAILRIQASAEPWPAESPWVRGLEVNERALRRFVAGLRLEYEQIMSAVPTD
jgi:hypothetical protein